MTTEDGVDLDGDVGTPDGDPVGGVVVCHPHPQYGGDRFHPVVDAVWSLLPTLGFVALRFDFRREFDGGVAERSDVVAAVDEVAGRTAGPVFVVGYSFGSVVALATPDDRVAGIVAIAPPIAVTPVDAPTVPTLLLVPRHDQFSPPEALGPVAADWRDCDVEVVESADHFLVGHARTVAEAAGAWLRRRL